MTVPMNNPGPPPPRKRFRKTKITLASVLAALVVIITLSVVFGGSSPSKTAAESRAAKLVTPTPTVETAAQKAADAKAAASASAAAKAQASSAAAAAAQQSKAAQAASQRAAAAAAAKARLANSVQFVVNGSLADVTYGPAGSDSQGSSGMDITQQLPSSLPIYYAITAQLQGGGQVSCQLKIGGQVVSSATASGGYNIASCEAVQDPISGGWQDANSG